ncbi:ferritin-like domain-containing protein [Leeuwenhoekiella sp. W20_SRS_FM14]|uniref:ferritin-like domain-containing protein n=1 Tax=Leeuwenhoekiella sp. W20_SRS_FM14 TaxID=3240270 RepID=UPI003F9643CB
MESDKQITHNELTESLQRLLVKNYDAEKDFIRAMQHLEHPALRGFMQRQAAKRSGFATELDRELHNLNETPKSSGTVVADLHRTWIELKNAILEADVSTVLEECLRGEKNSAHEYETVLQSHEFPQHIRTVINNQLSRIYRTIEDLQQLEDITKLQ